MLINSVTYYKCLCLSRIYHNPDLPNFFLQAYRIVLGIFCLYNCIINNWLYLPEYLDILLINYISELSTESNQVNMFPGSGNSSGAHQYGYFHSGGGSSFGGDPFGGGPSGSGGSGPPVGNESSTDKDKDEDSNKSKGKRREYYMYEAVENERDERRYWAPGATGNDYQTDNIRTRKKNYPWLSGLDFSYFDNYLNILCNPEHTHAKAPIIYRDNTIREYNEHGLKYVYHIYGDNPSCRISSTDGTRMIEIYDANTVKKYIEFHNEEVRIAKWHKENNKD
jgi:hypothetical protein